MKTETNPRTLNTTFRWPGLVQNNFACRLCADLSTTAGFARESASQPDGISAVTVSGSTGADGVYITLKSSASSAAKHKGCHVSA
jgi:hypothetical protein